MAKPRKKEAPAKDKQKVKSKKNIIKERVEVESSNVKDNKKLKNRDNVDFVETNSKCTNSVKSGTSYASNKRKEIIMTRDFFERSIFGSKEKEDDDDSVDDDEEEKEEDLSMKDTITTKVSANLHPMEVHSASKPTSVFVENKMDIEKDNSMIYVLNDFVKNQFFPKVKFIVDRDFEMAFSNKDNSYCQYVLKHCNVPDDINKKEWWRMARKSIMRKITELRNSKTSYIKWEFWCKYLLIEFVLLLFIYLFL